MMPGTPPSQEQKLHTKFERVGEGAVAPGLGTEPPLGHEA